MTTQFTLAVTFLTGRYHGDEWPPSPARLYQALVAGIMTCGYRDYAASSEPALRWLERLSPPVIRACEIEERAAYRIAVPNNDMDVAAIEWARGRPADAARLRTMKTVQPKELPRGGPHVQYVWQVDAAEAAALEESLRLAAGCLHTLGWGVDMAFADVAQPSESAVVYEPAAFGEQFSVPMQGTFDDLHSTYERFMQRAAATGGVDTYTRPSLLRMQRYRRTGEAVRPAVQFLLLQPDGEKSKAVAWEHCMKVAGWLRHAAAEQLAPEYDAAFIQQYVQGHTHEEQQSRRLSYVPVPSIYGPNPDGMIRRVLIVEPPDAPGDVTRMLRLKLTGRVLNDFEGQEVCSLAPAGAGDRTFERYQPRTAARVWRSVTPVVLHGFNADRRGQISAAKTERLLLRAFEMAGWGERLIEALAFQSAPWFPGAKHAAAMRVPNHLEGYPRLHVEVRFVRGVRGPVLAGIGRHYGIGVFARTE